MEDKVLLSELAPIAARVASARCILHDMREEYFELQYDPKSSDDRSAIMIGFERNRDMAVALDVLLWDIWNLLQEQGITR